MCASEDSTATTHVRMHVRTFDAEKSRLSCRESAPCVSLGSRPEIRFCACTCVRNARVAPPRGSVPFCVSAITVTSVTRVQEEGSW